MKKKTFKSNKNSTGHIRIISGQYRGRKLPVQNVTGLRPTTDRIKETVFNWLMTDIRDAKVIDCYSGSGGLGFEALSRYAQSATFLELDPVAAQQINDNLQLLQVKNAQLEHGNTLEILDQLTGKFDLAFIDPPFRKNLAQLTCDKLESNNLLAEDALIYVEVESELTNLMVPNSWVLLKEKKAGQVSCRLYQR